MWRLFICLLHNTSKTTERTPYVHVRMSDATYTQFASKGPHPCLWRQMGVPHKWGVMENLRFLNERMCLFTPTFHFMFSRKFTWVTHSRLLLCCFVYNSMQSTRHMQIYMLDFVNGAGCERCIRSSDITLQDDWKLKMMNWMTPSMTLGVGDFIHIPADIVILCRRISINMSTWTAYMLFKFCYGGCPESK